MNAIVKAVSILIFLASCGSPKSPQQMMEEIRENTRKDFEANNAEALAWEKIVDSLYKIADTNQVLSIRTIDNLIHNSSLNQYNISELHFIKGDIYYKVDSLEKSIFEYSIVDGTTNLGPKQLAARAGAYVKLKKYSNAYTDLTIAADINYDYLWNVGNFYEIVGKTDSAIACYDRLYKHDSIYYQYCLDRIIELKKPNTKPLTEIKYRDRKRMLILLH